MIVCPVHKTELIQDSQRLYCNQCDFQGVIEDDALYFDTKVIEDHEDFNSNILDRIFEDEEKNFWHINRKAFIKRLFLKYVNKSDKIIEIGAGTGNVSKMLIDNDFNVAIGEMHKKGLDYSKKYGIKERYQFDLTKSPFKEHFEVVGLFDVLEHIEDEKGALLEIYQMLKPGGKVVITVPAHNWLWNRKDAVNYHKRRYNLKDIKKLFISLGYEIIEARNFFVFLIPFLFIRKIMNRDDGSEINENEFAEDKRVNPVLNALLDKLLKFEFFLLKNSSPSIGGSIAVVAKKN